MCTLNVERTKNTIRYSKKRQILTTHDTVVSEFQWEVMRVKLLFGRCVVCQNYFGYTTFKNTDLKLLSY